MHERARWSLPVPLSPVINRIVGATATFSAEFKEAERCGVLKRSTGNRSLVIVASGPLSVWVENCVISECSRLRGELEWFDLTIGLSESSGISSLGAERQRRLEIVIAAGLLAEKNVDDEAAEIEQSPFGGAMAFAVFGERPRFL